MIDKKIAELRGDRICHDFDILGYCMTCDTKETSNAVRDSICQDSIKPYSTDIKFAFELWEEMKGAAWKSEIVADEYDIYVHLYLTEEAAFGDYASLSQSGETEAEAICGAWLKWREQ